MKGLAVVIGLYALYAVLAIRLHTSFLYPFFDRPFDMAGFEPALAGEAQLQVSAPGRVTIVYFMGNAGALALFEAPLLDHLAAGRGVVALEYPGGGGLEGEPSEERLKAQALAAYDWAVAEQGGPVVVHGYSLGSALALHVAARRDVAGVMLDAPFARICEQVARASLLPACWLPGMDRWASTEDAAEVTAPVLIRHGALDDLVLPKDSARLAEVLRRAGAEVTREMLEGADHNDLFRHPRYAATGEAFLDTID